MINQRRRVAIVFPAGAKDRPSTKMHQSRVAGVTKALAAAGIEVVGVPYSDDFAEKVRAELLKVDGVLVWVNPIQSGRDRSVLNALLADVSSKGVFVSAHPEVIAKMGTKEVLYRTAKMSWGSDTRLYTKLEAMHAGLPESLASGGPRVLKQIRGQSGEGVWKVELADPLNRSPSMISSNTTLRIREAKRDTAEERMSFEAFP